MKHSLLQIYHQMPYPVRSLAASARGLYLRKWRYGADTERLVEEALAREQWSGEQWKSYQAEKLARMLHRAATQVPFYREYWTERRQKGECLSWEELANWPVLEKDTLKANPRAFVSEDSDIRQMFHEHTSGTTGKSLDLWWSREMVRIWYALFEARWRGWYGLSRHDRWGILGGQLVTPIARRKPPFWVWNGAMNQLYLSTYHLAPDLIPYYLDAIRIHQVRYLWGYTSALHTLAQEMLRLKRHDIKMEAIITNAEPVYDYQREIIEKAFQCPLRETYGMAEAVTAASECEAGALHLWPEAGITEVLENDKPARSGHAGDFICTGLLNTDMPLIRYRVGDRGILADQNTTCPCGRTLPILTSVEGRQDDILYTLDGRRVGRLDPVFKTRMPLREAQIIQESLRCIRVLYVPLPDYTDDNGKYLIKELQARLGPVEVIMEAVDTIPRTKNGKFRAVICNIPEQDKPSYPADA